MLKHKWTVFKSLLAISILALLSTPFVGGSSPILEAAIYSALAYIGFAVMIGLIRLWLSGRKARTPRMQFKKQALVIWLFTTISYFSYGIIKDGLAIRGRDETGAIAVTVLTFLVILFLIPLIGSFFSNDERDQSPSS